MLQKWVEFKAKNTGIVGHLVPVYVSFRIALNHPLIYKVTNQVLLPLYCGLVWIQNSDTHDLPSIRYFIHSHTHTKESLRNKYKSIFVRSFT